MSKHTVQESVVSLGLNEELPIVEGSTTSRTLLDNPLLRVVMFTFDTGQLLTTHSSPRAVVVTILEGQMEFVLDGEPHLMDAGDILYMAPDAPHALTAKSPCRMQLVMVDPQQ